MGYAIARAYSAAVQDRIEEGIRRIAHGIAEAHGVVETVRYERRYPAVVNAPGGTDIARQVLEGLVGAEHVDANVEPRMTAEDFAFMLQAKAGCYVFIGNGDGPDARRVHNPEYDFNDEILPLGASYWARLVEHVLRPA